MLDRNVKVLISVIMNIKLGWDRLLKMRGNFLCFSLFLETEKHFTFYLSISSVLIVRHMRNKINFFMLIFFSMI